MKKAAILLLPLVFLAMNLAAQMGQGQQRTPEERAQMTLDELSKTVTFTAKQKTDLNTIFTKFYAEAREKHAFRDPAVLAPMEKDRDAKVEKALNDKALYKKYVDAMAAMKKKWEQQRGQGGR